MEPSLESIPIPVIQGLRKVTRELLDGRARWQTDHIVGVGLAEERQTWKIRIYLKKPGIPPQLAEYMQRLEGRSATLVTGRFHFLLGVGGEIWSSCAGGAGTLTAIVQKEDGQFLLSCHHVLGEEGCVVDDAHTGGLVARTTNVLPYDNEPISADAGIASLAVPVPTDWPEFPDVIDKTPVDLEMGDHVSHCGAVTHSAASTITDVEVTLKINIDGVPRQFCGIALVDPCFAQPGDSGSVVVNTDKQRPTGIVFARGSFEGRPTKVAICSLGAALTNLGVTIA